MSMLDPFFKFKIGDTVRPKAHRPGYDQRGNLHLPQICVVVERQLQECYAAIQAHYSVRVHTEPRGWSDSYSFMLPPFMLTEPELEAYEPPPLTDTAPERPRRTSTLPNDVPIEGETNAPV